MQSTLVSLLVVCCLVVVVANAKPLFDSREDWWDRVEDFFTGRDRSSEEQLYRRGYSVNSYNGGRNNGFDWA